MNRNLKQEREKSHHLSFQSAKKSLSEQQRSASSKRWRRSNRFPRPFPILTPQSYISGEHAYSDYDSPTPSNPYPELNQNSYVQPMHPTDPPLMNVSGEPALSPMPPPLPPMPPSYPSPPGPSMPVYDPGRASYSYDQYSSRRSRPIVRILESCSSTSSCSTISIAPRRTPRVQHQPIILMPYHCSQPTSTGTGQLTTLPPIHINSSSYLPHSTTANPLIVNSSPSVFQPSRSVGPGQRLRAGPIQYVLAAPSSTSTTQLQYISSQSRSARAPSHELVNRSKTRSRSRTKSVSLVPLAQKDLKFGRRPFDWYTNGGQDVILKDNICIGRRRLVSLG